MVLMGKMVVNYQQMDISWIWGKILTGNPWLFTIKLVGLSGKNFPIIQFYDGDGDWLLIAINYSNGY